MKLDILVLAAHPDDAELGCGGTIAKHADLGLKVGVIDFTRGELGTRGTPELRKEEAAASAKILGIVVRDNLGFRDGFFKNDEEHQLQVVRKIREYQPDIILASAVVDRHPDHGRAAGLAQEAFFLSGLKKIDTVDNAGRPQAHWRPSHLYHYIQSDYIPPDFVVDISGFWERKEKAIQCYKSQFHNPENKEPETYISRPGFLDMIKARSVDLGLVIGCNHGEGFTTRRIIGVNHLSDIR